MVKFLSGDRYDGERVPVCTYWQTESVTDVTQDFASIVGQRSDGQCIANAFFRRDQITCFNQGQCNGEGKCLPCSKYKYGGMRLAITHSPPLEILRQFSGGLTEAEVRSPNLTRFPPEVINTPAQDQIPYHILIKNVQAKIAKCCHWSSGDGAPSEFFLAQIVEGSESVTLTTEDGQEVHFRGIKVKNDEFPDETGTFFPVGTVVVAGFRDEPSFYLEPRTGLVKPGEGVIFSTAQQSPILTRLKQKAAAASRAMIDTTNATVSVCNSITAEILRQSTFLTNIQNSNNVIGLEDAQAKVDDLTERQETVCTAAQEAKDLATEGNQLIQSIIADDETQSAAETAKELATILTQIADKAEAAALAGLGDGAARLASNLAGILRQIARDMEQAGFRSFSKCEFFFEENNIAKQWNNPEDGTTPCNGIRTDCDFYTGKAWEFANEENLELGKKIKPEVLQELRFRSDDWQRFDDPDEEFRRRFSTPFIWSFKQYVDISGQPEVEDLILYKPDVLFARNTSDSHFQTIEVEKVAITDFTNFGISKSRARIQPGSNTLDRDLVPEYPTLVSEISVPTITRLSITHPKRSETAFIYRSWSPDKNKITLFGTSTPEAKIFLVNDTALRDRNRYHTFLETRNFTEDFPIALPGTPNFTGIFSTTLQDIFSKLEDEKRINESTAPLGYATAVADTTGFWRSVQDVDLVHNKVNKIYAFIVINDVQFIFDSVEVDYRFLHSIPVQTSFQAKDFSMQDAGGYSSIASNIRDTTASAQINAELRQIVGKEAIRFAYGYYGLRFRDRGLTKGGNLNADNDLQVDPSIADEVENPAIASLGPNTITSVGYNVVQYRKTTTIEDWYVANDCGFVMINIPDITANRVLPLPNQNGAQVPLTNILINGGAKGSEIAQFGIEEAFINTRVGRKKLVQVYRDPDGFGLPANYILLGPSVEVEEAFGRPNEERDTIEITYTYLQAQDAPREVSQEPEEGEGGEEEGEDTGGGESTTGDEVVKDNFYGDTFRSRFHNFTFTEDSGDLKVGDTSAVADFIRDLNQEYVWVIADETGRPLGRKYSRLMVMYYGLSAVNVEMYYAWEGSCSTYALTPDLFLAIGGASGNVVVQPQGVTDPGNLILGFRLADKILGSGQVCTYSPSCGDHEILFTAIPRTEFEVIEAVEGGLRAVHVNAGAQVTGQISSVIPAEVPFNVRRGPLWYPYILCERPRYDLKNSIGPLKTQSTELINEQLEPAGFNIGVNVLQDDQVKAAGGTFGNLERIDMEAYRGVDLVRAMVLDIHTTLRACTESYTYGNQVLDGRISQFAGAARRRGAVEVDIYGEKGWELPKFGNLGRSLLFLEVTDRRGDYITDSRFSTGGVSFRWMPIFPDRESLFATTDLFTENLELQIGRLLQASSPAGSINESVNTASPARLTHKALLRNAPLNVDYPFVGFFPTFLSDNLRGLEPEERKDQQPTGDISTMWAWREKEAPIRRGIADTVLAGIKLRSPDYILDNRSLEVRLRPNEGNHQLIFTNPLYDIDTGEITQNAKLKLDDGPDREIIIDFKERNLSLATQEDSVYDVSLELGDGPFPCVEGTAPDNENFFGTCSCETDVTADALADDSFPSRFLHLDEVAPEGFFSLYENSNLQKPFAAPLARQSVEDPCCQCIYYIRGIFAALDLEYLPTTANVNPAFDNRIEMSYTWSRVPHGFPEGQGVDGSFNASETLAENYLDLSNGEVFSNFFDPTVRVFELEDVAAFFPSSEFALSQNADGNPILVSEVPESELKPGANEATDGISRGENEPIVLDFRFNAYVKITSIKINFCVGRGWRVPRVSLSAIDPDFRGPSSLSPTLRTERLLAESTLVANGTEVPFPELLDLQALSQGLPEGKAARFSVNLFPSYLDNAFWNKFAMEFHLRFDGRGSDGSMGIASIEVIVDSFLPNRVITEIIGVRERKYYISTGSPGGGINPEARLAAADSATAYWRSTDQEPVVGSNKFRAYAWGKALEDNQDFEKNDDPKVLEALQEEEYNKSRELFEAPYTFTYQGFLPIEEQQAVNFYEGVTPAWSNTLTLELSPLANIGNGGSTEDINSRYGIIPERKPWSAPGHAWTYSLEPAYLVCDPSRRSTQVVNYNFAHLHDNLDVVQTASFWEELPSGFTRLLRSTEIAPDPFFGQGLGAGQPGIPGEPGGTGQAALLDASMFEGIDPAVLEKAGFRQDENGNLVLLVQGGE